MLVGDSDLQVLFFPLCLVIELHADDGQLEDPNRRVHSLYGRWILRCSAAHLIFI